MTEKKKKLFLIDGNSYLYRSYYAIKNLRTRKGAPTNAVFGFARLLFRIIKVYKPDYLAFAFDTKGPTFRHLAFKDYKAHREPPPEELIIQMPVTKDLIKSFNMPSFELQGYEADDIITYLAKKGEKSGLSVTILTGDKDLLQLVNDNIQIMSAHKDDYIYDSEKVKEKYGITPLQMIDFLALLGDASDNIPGVDGIGEKTASELLKEFKGLDDIYANIEKVKSDKLREKLLKGRESAYFSRQLATLIEPPLEIKIEDLLVKDPDVNAVISKLGELEFTSLREEFRKLKYVSAPAVEIDLFSEEVKEKSNISELKNKEEIKELFNNIITHKKAAVRLKAGKIYFSYADKSGSVLDFDKTSTEGIFSDNNISLTFFDYKNFLREYNGEIPVKEVFDCLLAAYLLNPDRGSYTPAEIIFRYLSKNPAENEEICFLLALQEILKKELAGQNLLPLFENIEMPLVPVLASMEKAGIKLDLPYLKKLSVEIEKKLEGLVKNIYELAGGEFNINSPQQLGKILFEKLKLPVIKKTKTGASTDVEVLEELSGKSPLPAFLLEYRQLTKLKNTYIDALPLLADKENKIHTSFDQTGTATGRLSSLNPNIQNIPVRTEIGKEIRRAFIASEKGWKIISADYSQIELRILAHFSGDANLLDAFKKDEDVHSRTASEIFNMEKAAVTGDERRIAKTVNFGIIYGISAFGLAKQLKISRTEAQKYIDSYLKNYTGVEKFIKDSKEKARKSGFVETLLGRKRYIPDIDSSNKNTREFAERVAINAPIQGSASDIIKLAMVKLYCIMKKEDFKGRLLLQVHDELILECPEKDVESLKILVKETMENVVKLKVPVKVDVSSGDNWCECK
ncbi:MAG: DNA polymerase I [Candidatus Firestonebacteria bacterium RIFOXYC2_FULL_39_67]|nr:MAG: DNA polymerase I [Candidatus Firestonebacteria bacterium RIFOXYD2_FULL_39_29]OGF56807.1 MAG: DNA polymerase I [Candidatus Firestonebacteria bacterium RIFOXYC2_FULL_39_67]